MVVTICAIIALLVVAYLLGSIPSAVWIGKHYYGIDIREYGSKNAGATNMFRVLGARAAIPVFVIDFLKGFLAVSAMSIMKYDLSLSPSWVINLKIITVAVVVLGHIFPIFASFKGGKGVYAHALVHIRIEIIAHHSILTCSYCTPFHLADTYSSDVFVIVDGGYKHLSGGVSLSLGSGDVF